MKASEAIRHLQNMDPDQEVIFACWTAQDFAKEDKAEEYKRVFDEYIHIIDDSMDWSCDYDSMIIIMDNILENENESQ